jgi:quinol monooxygenase YgiN
VQKPPLVIALILPVLLGIAASVAAHPSTAARGALRNVEGQAPPTAPPQPAPGPRYIVTYVDVAPASESQALNLLKGYRDASRREDGNVRADILQQGGRPGQFVVIEEWRDDAAFKAHRSAAPVMHFHEKLAPLRITAYDERVHTNFAAAAHAAVPANAVFVVTHVDVVPNGLPKARELLNSQVEHTRKETGNVRFDVLQGARMNHFTVVEVWRDDRTREAHIGAAHSRTYREGLRETAIDGSPYDERLYRMVQ